LHRIILSFFPFSLLHFIVKVSASLIITIWFQSISMRHKITVWSIFTCHVLTISVYFKLPIIIIAPPPPCIKPVIHILNKVAIFFHYDMISFSVHHLCCTTMTLRHLDAVFVSPINYFVSYYCIIIIPHYYTTAWLVPSTSLFLKVVSLALYHCSDSCTSILWTFS